MTFPRKIGRRRLLIILFCLWGIIIIGRASFFSVIDREKYRMESRRASWRNGTIPAIRGRILDASGVPLAWTEMINTLSLTHLPKDENRKSELSAYLMKNFSFDLSSVKSFPCDVLRNVPPNLMQEAVTASGKYRELTLASVMERRRVEYSSIRRMTGVCTQDETGLMHGLDGWEKEYDVILCGRNGCFSVMLDKHGNWIDGTLVVISSPQHGNDFMLDKTIDELLKENWKQ